MSKVDQSFQHLCKTILKEGREYENKNRGVKRLQIPSYTIRHLFSDGFPAITNKKLYWKGIVGELIWFLRGDNDVNFLNRNGIKIWNKDAYNWYVKNYSNNDPIEGQEDFYHRNEDGSYRMFTFEEFSEIGKGSVGQNYSVQWRNFNGLTDQIQNLVEDMVSDIMSSRLKVNAWNPSEIFETALPPCHSEFQIIGVPLNFEERFKLAGWDDDEINDIIEKGLEMEALENIPRFGFELHWNQRSVDTFLGLPFNIASYGLLAKILEQITGYPAIGIEGTLKCVHFYDNQYSAAEELLKRDPNKHSNCEVELPELEPDSFTGGLDEIIRSYKISDFKLVGYSSDENIKVDMLAPKE